MIRVNIVCVGNLKESYWREAQQEYLKRLQRFCKVTVTEIAEQKLPENPSKTQIEMGIKAEGERIAEKIGNSKVVALCIEGKAISSQELSSKIDNLALSGVSELVFVIGGSYGLADDIKNRAIVKMSMSAMTFPHQMARVILLEQIYRSMQISSGGKYHK